MNASFSKVNLLLCVIFFLAFESVGAQELDPNFNPSITGSSGLNVSAGVGQPDGKVIVAGQFVAVNKYAAPGFARINSDGSLDESFQTGAGFSGTVNAMVRQNDGKIIVVGKFTAYNNLPASNIVRLNTDGTIDASFNTGTGFDNYATAVLVQPDGKILVTGPFTKFNNVQGNSIVRLNTDGSRDTSFSAGSGTGDYSIADMALQRDGKILIVGSFEQVNGQAKPRVARLETNGAVDATFNSGKGPSSIVFSVAIQIVNSEDRILIGGLFNKYNDVATASVVRLMGDGSLDTSLQLSGLTTKVVRDVYTLFDDIFVGTNSDFTRYSSTGSATTLATSAVTWITNYGPDKILVGGSKGKITNVDRTGVAIIDGGGTLVNTFNPLLANAGLVTSFIELSDGKFLVGGDFDRVNGLAAGHIARLNPDGSVDVTFTTGTGFSSSSFSEPVNHMAVQTDGKIVVAGWLNGYNGVRTNELNGLVRLNANGTLDNTFVKPYFVGSSPLHLLSLPNNKILIVQFPHDFIRFNVDGSLDNTFNGGSPFIVTGEIGGVALLPDGRVVIAQVSTNETVLKVLLDNGSLGATIATIQDRAKKMIVTSAGQIYVGCGGNSSGGVGNVYRVNPDGTVVRGGASFHAAISNDIGSVYAMAVSNNTLIAGGYFQKSLINNTPVLWNQSYMAAFETSGAFLPGTTPVLDGKVNHLFALSQGRIFAAGDFLKVDGIARNKSAMLKMPANAPAAPSSLTGEFTAKQQVGLTWVDNASNETAFEIQRAPKGSTTYTVAYIGKANETSWDDVLQDAQVRGYSYKIRALNVAGASAFVESALITGIEERTIVAGLLYPNPTSGVMQFAEKVTRGSIVQVTDLRGQQKLVSSADESLDLSFLPAGIYLVTLDQNGKRVVTRVVKTN